MSSCEGAAIYGDYIEYSTITTKLTVLDYHREQVAVKDSERKASRKR